jgi:hypothetical protein
MPADQRGWADPASRHGGQSAQSWSVVFFGVSTESGTEITAERVNYLNYHNQVILFRDQSTH